jgi:hypothetical protein
VIDHESVERAAERFKAPDGALERLIRRRDRKRRNQRIAAGVVGIAVFVAAIWIVTSGLSLDRSEKSVAPAGEVTRPAETGPAETGPAETGPAETAPPAGLASVTPDVARPGWCADGARSRLELTDIGDRIEARFEVHDSPPGHLWHIRIWRERPMSHTNKVFRGARVASDSGDLAVDRLTPDTAAGGPLGVRVKAIDSATGEVCDVYAVIHAQ